VGGLPLDITTFAPSSTFMDVKSFELTGKHKDKTTKTILTVIIPNKISNRSCSNFFYLFQISSYKSRAVIKRSTASPSCASDQSVCWVMRTR